MAMWQTTITLFSILLLCNGTVADTCSNSACIQLGDSLRRSIDTSVDPCQDFYMYSCGNYIKNTPIPPDELATGIFEETCKNIINLLLAELESKTTQGQPPVFQKAKAFFDSCTNSDATDKRGLMDMKRYIKSYGGWPLLENNWNSREFDWIETTRRLAEAGEKSDMIATVRVGPNENNVTHTIVRLRQRPWEEEADVTYFNLLDGINSPVVQAYYHMMVDVAVEFGAKRSKAEQQLLKSIQFEIDLANMTNTDENNDAVILNVHQLMKKYPHPNWFYLIKSVLGQYSKITKRNEVELYDPVFARKLGALLAKTPSRVIANYIMTRVVVSHIQTLTNRLAQLYQTLLDVKYGESTPPSQPLRCVNEMVYHYRPVMATILGTAYVRKYFKDDSKVKALELSGLLQKQLLTTLEQSDWLDPFTRKQALEKVSKIRVFAGYPKEFVNDTYLDNYFHTLKMDSKKYLDNVLNIGKFKRYVDINLLNQKYNPQAWDRQKVYQVVDPNASYLLYANAINIFAGNLADIFFDVARPLFLNIATIGGVIAHEFTHSVSVQGSEYDKGGNRINWWDKQTKDKFNKLVKGVQDEYATYVVGDINETLRPEYYIDEIVADQGGYKLARMALEEHLTTLPEDPRLKGFEQFSARKLFWIANALGWCETVRPKYLKEMTEVGDHPPNEFRVNGPFRNSLAFGKDWQCEPGSYMNPEKKFNVW